MKKATPFLPLIHVWMSGQILLPEVDRWLGFYNKRPQNTLQHTYALTVLGSIMLVLFQPYLLLDRGLILMCLLLHDAGEGELHRDIRAPEKTARDDVDEYSAFMRRIAELHPEVQLELERAFMLQFAHSDMRIWPKRARRQMHHLREHKHFEILFFRAMEHFDYVLYALEQLEYRDHTEIAKRVIAAEIANFDELAENLPGFRQVIWTDEFRTWCVKFVSDCEVIDCEVNDG